MQAGCVELAVLSQLQRHSWLNTAESAEPAQMSRLHWFGLRIWFCTLQLAEKASCTDPAVIPGCIEQVYLYKPSVPIRLIEAICTKPGWYSRLYRIRV